MFSRILTKSARKKDMQLAVSASPNMKQNVDVERIERGGESRQTGKMQPRGKNLNPNKIDQLMLDAWDEV